MKRTKKQPTGNLLWVETSKDYVRLRPGGAMPKPYSAFSMFMPDNTLTRTEFKRWSGLDLPKGDGIYGLRVTLAVIERYREVKETKFVAAEHTTRKLVKVVP